MSRATKRGLSYEARVLTYLKPLVDELGWELWDHKWMTLEGRVCQPDFVLLTQSGAVILETKLTWTDITEQRTKYLEALSFLGVPLTFVQVCRNLTPHTSQIVTELWDIYPDCVWHLWI